MCVRHVIIMLHSCPHVIRRSQFSVEAAQRYDLASVMGSNFPGYSDLCFYSYFTWQNEQKRAKYPFLYSAFKIVLEKGLFYCVLLPVFMKKVDCE